MYSGALSELMILRPDFIAECRQQPAFALRELKYFSNQLWR